MPRIPFSVQTRCYSPLLLLVTVQTIAFAAMLERPAPQRATCRVMRAALAFPGPDFAAFTNIAQALRFPVREWWRAGRRWPERLPFVPAGF